MITYAALAPHPPLIVPEIGKQRVSDVQPTVDGMHRLAEELTASQPDTVIFLTPHGNVFADAISALGQPQLEGSLAAFGGRHNWTGLKNDLPLLAEIARRTGEEGIPFVIIDQEIAIRHKMNPHLDHGILVPWYYLQEAGLSEVNLIIISIAYISRLDLYRFGTILQQAAQQMGRRAAILASGDMSHRLKDDGPYQYHPDGPLFDRTINRLLAAGDVEGIMGIPKSLGDNAGECGFRSIVIMLGSLDGLEFEPHIFSYEGPFGVGYLTAGFTPGAPRSSLLPVLKNRQRQQQEQLRSQESLPVKWARLVLESHVNNQLRPELPAEMVYLHNQRAGAFVSLKKQGQLRGCIGTISPAYGNLADEIAGNAVGAASHDPRFLPVEPYELDELEYSVDILGQPEPCRREELDPKRYGVIVSQGNRRGLLLPDLEGVDTVEQQLAIALQKAGIRRDENYSIERFEVNRYT